DITAFGASSVLRPTITTCAQPVRMRSPPRDRCRTSPPRRARRGSIMRLGPSLALHLTEGWFLVRRILAWHARISALTRFRCISAKAAESRKLGQTYSDPCTRQSATGGSYLNAFVAARRLRQAAWRGF